MLDNDDDVMVPPGSGLPVGNSYEWFQCMVHKIWIFKEKHVFILYYILYYIFVLYILVLIKGLYKTKRIQQNVYINHDKQCSMFFVLL